MATLALVRHGESTYNAQGIWTGWDDPPLSEKGREEAQTAGNLIKDIKFDYAFTSPLLRSTQTFDEALKTAGLTVSPGIAPDFKERNYGDYTGKNKWDVKKQLGEDGFKKLRRAWDDPIPNGETLRDVYNRAVPYYQKEVLPKLKTGKNILIVAHGNSLRALTKYLENISDQGIEDVEIPTGQVIIYQIDSEGKVASKEIRKLD